MITIDMDGCTVDQILLAVRHQSNMDAAEPIYLVGEPVGATAAEMRRLMQTVNSNVTGAEFNG